MKKRTLATFLALCMMISMMPAGALAAGPEERAGEETWIEAVGEEKPGGYEDTDGTVIKISSQEGLAWLAKQVNGGKDYKGQTVTLTKDIDLAGRQWVPIGTQEYPFSGTFDGKDFTITGLRLGNLYAENNYVGLFGKAQNAIIQNINLEGTTIKTTVNGSGAAWALGSLAGSVLSTSISNVSVSDSDFDIDVKNAVYVLIGGIVGISDAVQQKDSSRSHSVFSGCLVDGLSVTYDGAATYHISTGGILGGQGKTATDASVIGLGSSVKLYGLATTIENSSVTDFSFVRETETSSNYEMVGGIVGYARSEGEVEDCHTSGLNFSVSANVPEPSSSGGRAATAVYGIYGGGIAGSLDGGLTVRNCTTEGSIETDVTGGFEVETKQAGHYVSGGFFGGITGLIGSMPEIDGWGDLSYNGAGATIQNCFANISFTNKNTEAMRHASALYATAKTGAKIVVENFFTACTIKNLDYNDDYPLLGPNAASSVKPTQTYRNIFLVTPRTMYTGIADVPADYGAFYNGGWYGEEYQGYWEQFKGENGSEHYQSDRATPTGGGTELTFSKTGTYAVDVKITKNDGTKIAFQLPITVKEPYTLKAYDLTVYQGGQEPKQFFPEIAANAEITVKYQNEDEIGFKKWSFYEYYGQGKYPFEVTLRDSEDNEVDWENLQPGTYTLKMGLKDVGGGETLLCAYIDGIPVSLEDGVLTIRPVSQVQAADELVTNILDSSSSEFATNVKTALEVAGGKGVAAIHHLAGTAIGDFIYTNGRTSGLGCVSANAQIALLFDDLLNVGNREQMLIEQAESQGHSMENRQYQFKYLDLVDTSNGNAWVSTSQEITIYWPYPAGTNQDTKFDLLHFTGLHREYGDPYGEEELNAQISACTVEDITVETDINGIYFTLKGDPVNGNFSPFALVWGEKQEPVTPDPDPNPGTGTGSDNDNDYTLYYHSNFGKDKSFYQSDDSSRMEVRDYGDMSFLPDREGYVFTGWNTEPDGSGDDYAPGDIFRLKRSTDHLYAQWARAEDGVGTGVSRWLNTDDHSAYLSGYPDGAFGPDRNMTRAEVAQMFYGLLWDKEVEITASFTDVSEDAWYAEAVNTLASLGLVSGVGDGQFAPDRAVTRAEFATMAMGFAYLETGGENHFSDVSRSDWFYEYVVSAAGYGWISGYPDGTFRPGNTITRGEVTTIVNNMLARAADEDYVDDHEEDLVRFTDLSGSHWAYYQIMEATNGHDYRTSGGVEQWRGLR